MTFFSYNRKTFDLKLSYKVPKFGSMRQIHMGREMSVLNNMGVMMMHKLNNKIKLYLQT